MQRVSVNWPLSICCIPGRMSCSSIDRDYPAFWLFAFHAKEQRHYCARVRHDFHSEVKAFVADGAKERIVVLTPNTASARQCREGHLPADPLRVRLIRVELESGEVEVLTPHLAAGYESLSVSCLRQALCATLGHRGELQARKSNAWRSRIFQAEALGCYCRISTPRSLRRT